MFKIGDRVIVTRALTKQYKGATGTIVSFKGSNKYGENSIAVLKLDEIIEGSMDANFYIHKLDKITEVNEI